MNKGLTCAVLSFFFAAPPPTEAASGRIVSIEPSTFIAGQPEVLTVAVQNTGQTADFLVLYADSVCDAFNGVPPGWSIRPLKVWDLNFWGDYNPIIPAGAIYEATFEITPPTSGGSGTFVWKLQDDGLFCDNPLLDQRVGLTRFAGHPERAGRGFMFS